MDRGELDEAAKMMGEMLRERRKILGVSIQIVDI
jgi:hypothetical protein